MAAARRLNEAANRIAGGGDDDYASEAVNTIEARQAYKANIGVIKVADEMWQSLLDLQASPHAAR